MNRRILLAALLTGGTWLLSASSGQAWFRGEEYPSLATSNPLTGGYDSRFSSYNPYTGRYSYGAAGNNPSQFDFCPF
jgi:hypothetical protein